MAASAVPILGLGPAGIAAAPVLAAGGGTLLAAGTAVNTGLKKNHEGGIGAVVDDLL